MDIKPAAIVILNRSVLLVYPLSMAAEIIIPAKITDANTSNVWYPS